MMSQWGAFIIGVLQGLTEFFPISSSAHIKLAKFLFGIETGEEFVLFDLSCHLGTLLAVLVYFRKEIAALMTTERHRLFLLFVATLPLVPCYFLLKPLRLYASRIEFLGFFLILTGLILFIGQKVRLNRPTEFNLRRQIYEVLWIGALQATALIPGISRSASTISCATFMGWQPRDAVRFSFLLAIPTILGGNAAEVLHLSLSLRPASFSLSACCIGFLSAAAVGFVMIRLAIGFLEKGNLKPFAWYCVVLGIFVLTYLNYWR